MNTSKLEQALSLIKEKKVMRPMELDAYGIPRDYLWKLSNKGLIIQLNRGVYAASYDNLSQFHDFVQVSTLVSDAVICLLSALQFHELTTQLPHEVWFAIDRRARKPEIKGIPIRVLRFSGKALTEGVEIHHIEGRDVNIYSVAKTVADCFKYRNKIGIDVAIEALKDCLKYKKATVNEIWKYAEICRVNKVMYPYLEAI